MYVIYVFDYSLCEKNRQSAVKEICRAREVFCDFVFGDRQEGSMVALMMFSLKIGVATGMFAAGLILDRFGFDGMAFEQSERALQGILTSTTLVPAIGLIIAIFIFAKYPVTKKAYETLCAALEKKRAGEEYSTEGIDCII